MAQLPVPPVKIGHDKPVPFGQPRRAHEFGRGNIMSDGHLIAKALKDIHFNALGKDPPTSKANGNNRKSGEGTKKVFIKSGHCLVPAS